MRDVMILGSTGSIGTQALQVLAERPRDFRVQGLAAGGGQPELLAQQVVQHRPGVVALADEQSRDAFEAALAAAAQAAGVQPVAIELLTGQNASAELAGRPVDVVLNAITGSAGLPATLACLGAGTTLALANKESLVIGGKLVTDVATPGQIIAVDSEHSAIAQALRAGRRDEVSKLILTASGGPFRGWTRDQMSEVTPEQALAHPTWNMGRVITINSATLVNKGLELLEAHLLYAAPLEDIQVVVHPQSIVHSGVEFTDGAAILQASPPDMKLPIGLALTWPDRMPGVAAPCDWTRAGDWRFEPLDDAAFPAVELARRAGRAAGTAPAVYNGANEACVDAFCAGRIGFLDIVDTIADVLSEHLVAGHVADGQLTLEAVLAADQWARARAGELA